MDRLTDTGWVSVVLAALAVIGAVFSVVTERLRSAALFLWITGVSVGGVYLAFGAEYLAIVQWTISTLAAISFVFYSVLFGEEKRAEKNWIWISISLLTGLGLILVSIRSLGDLASTNPKQVAAVNLLTIGRELISEDFLALKVLLVCLFVVSVGAGILARPEVED